MPKLPAKSASNPGNTGESSYEINSKSIAVEAQAAQPFLLLNCLHCLPRPCPKRRQARGLKTEFTPQGTTAFSHDAGDRLTQFAGQPVTYDGEGNLTSRSTFIPGGNGTQTTASISYSWNARNQLTRVAGPGSYEARFAYDALGRRVAKSTPTSGTTGLGYDGANPVVEFDKSSGQLTGRNLAAGLDAYVGRTDGADAASQQATWPLTDHLGSVLALMDQNGAIVTDYRYGSYGQTRQSGGISTNFTAG